MDYAAAKQEARIKCKQQRVEDFAGQQDMRLELIEIELGHPAEPLARCIERMRPEYLDIIVIKAVNQNMQPSAQETGKHHRQPRRFAGQADEAHALGTHPAQRLEIIHQQAKDSAGRTADQQGMKVPELVNRPAGLKLRIGQHLDIDQHISRHKDRYIEPLSKQQANKTAGTKMIWRKRHGLTYPFR